MEVLPNRLISLLSDYGFKITFGNERNKNFLKKAIPLLTKTNVEIKTVRHLPSEFEGITEDARKGFYDTVCLINNELYFILEMQVGNYKFLLERLMFYASQLYISQITKGKKGFLGVKKIHCICITKDTIFENVTEYYHKLNYKSETGNVVIDKIEFILIELEKFTKLADEIDNELEEILFTMKNAHTIDLNKPREIPHFWKKEYLQEVVKELNLSTMSPLNRALYNIRIAGLIAINEQFEIDMKAERRKMRRELKKEVKAEVKEEVKAEVKEEVKAEVKEEVKAEVKEELKAEVILEIKAKSVEKMLLQGKLSVADIAEIYDMKIEDILQIKAKMS
jgi:predicted transposase/invertase (TIGR01784 family)